MKREPGLEAQGCDRRRPASDRWHTVALELLERIESHVRRHDLIEPGGEVLCLVSGGADSTCLFHALARARLSTSRRCTSTTACAARSPTRDARWCAERFGAEVVQAAARCATEAELRDVRYSFRAGELRATGHTLSDQVETILYRLASSGTTKGIKVRREDGVVRPLLCVWREETEAFCRERGLEWRTDSSNADTLRGLIRNEILPLLERIHPAARENVLRALDERRTMPPALAELLDAPRGLEARRPRRRRAGGARARPALARARPASTSTARSSGGSGGSSRGLPGLKVRGWRPGDRLAGRTKKIQDVFVDAKIPRSDREGWPLVVRGDEVVAVPGIVEAEGVTRDPCRRLRSKPASARS